MDELYGTTQRKHCKWLAKQFAKKGREVNLKEIRRESNLGADLQYTCVFEGKDAVYGAKMSEKQRERLWSKK